MILMQIVGGIGTLGAPVLGAVVYVLLREQVIACDRTTTCLSLACS